MTDLYRDHHMHTRFSDGRGSVDDMAAAAVTAGLQSIAITDHMPLPVSNRYALEDARILEYRTAVSKTADRFKDRLDVRLGMEIEFIPDFLPWIRQVTALGWEHLILSIHHLWKKGRGWLVNGTREEFDECLNQGFNGEIEPLVSHYYDTLLAGVNTGLCNSVGHLDVVKKHNRGQRFFDESEAWYQDLVLSVLDAVQDQGLSLEINTAGMNHPVEAFYPSRWILEAALEKEIPIVLSSDAHTPESVGQHFPQARTDLDLEHAPEPRVDRKFRVSRNA